MEEKHLCDAIRKFSVLEPFVEIPSKENGIDIEGISARGKKLYIGFCGPVFRENWVPIIVTEFDDLPGKAILQFVSLQGLGIRDIVALDDSFLLLGTICTRGMGSTAFPARMERKAKWNTSLQSLRKAAPKPKESQCSQETMTSSTS